MTEMNPRALGKLTFFFITLLLSMGATTLLHAEKDPAGYYRMKDRAEAEAEAQKEHLPLVWLGTSPELVNVEGPERGSGAEVTQMCLHYFTHNLKGRVVVILYMADMEIAQLPPSAYQVFEHYDEGKLPNGMWYPPKIAFTSGDTLMILGRATYTQMKTHREDPIDAVMSHIETDPDIQAKLNSAPAAIPGTPGQIQFPINQNSMLLLVFGGVVGLLFLWILYRAVTVV